ncbi:MAG: carbohydrate-binding domain-containing protein [Huintestinicola sp.]
MSVLSILLAQAVMLSACSSANVPEAEESTQAALSASTELSSAASSADISNMSFEIDEKDMSAEYDEANIITLSDTTITKGGVYRITGTITDETVTVAAGDKDTVTLVLDNASVINSNGPAIYIRSANKVYITLKDGTANTLSDGSSYTMTDGSTTVDAALFSKADLTVNGTGTLTVEGNCKHGIVSKDDLIITSASMNVTSKNVGLNGKDCVKISGGSYNITAGSDGIRSDNDEDTSKGYVYIDGGTLNITAANDGIQAETVIKADNAEITITSGGGSTNSLSSSEESFKGIKAGSDIIVSEGTYSIDSADDCIHSNNNISISGGTFTLSSGDDGIHADNELNISGGNINISKSYEGLESSRILISGGNIAIVSSDDGLNAAGGNDGSATGMRFGRGEFGSSAGEIVISGGYIVIDASGDGIDSNGSIEISGGVTLVSSPTNNGNGALDYDTTAAVSRGVLAALGSSGMAQSVTDSESQGVLACTFSRQNGGETFLVCDESGNVILSFTPQNAYECAVVTAPELKADGTYKIVTGASVSDADENGFAQNTTYSGGTELEYSTLTANSFGAPGGRGGGMPPQGREDMPKDGIPHRDGEGRKT